MDNNKNKEVKQEMPFEVTEGIVVVDLSFIFESKTKGGIHLPESAIQQREKMIEQKLSEPLPVLAFNITEHGRLAKMNLEVGDYILAESGAKIFKYGKVGYGLVGEHELTAIFKKDKHEKVLAEIAANKGNEENPKSVKLVN